MGRGVFSLFRRFDTVFPGRRFPDFSGKTRRSSSSAPSPWTRAYHKQDISLPGMKSYRIAMSGDFPFILSLRNPPPDEAQSAPSGNGHRPKQRSRYVCPAQRGILLDKKMHAVNGFRFSMGGEQQRRIIIFFFTVLRETYTWSDERTFTFPESSTNRTCFSSSLPNAKRPPSRRKADVFLRDTSLPTARKTLLSASGSSAFSCRTPYSRKLSHGVSLT